MKTIEEIFVWMMHNARYDEKYISREHVQKAYDENDIISLYAWSTHTTAFVIKQELFEGFVGEKYSFSKHFEPLVNQGLIHGSGYRHMSADEKKNWDKVLGLVKNYQTSQSYVKFWLGKENDLPA